MVLTDLLPVVNEVPSPRTRPLWAGFAVCDDPWSDDGQRWIVDQVADLITDFVLRTAADTRLVLFAEEGLRTHAGVRVHRQQSGGSRSRDDSVPRTSAIGLRRRSS